MGSVTSKNPLKCDDCSKEIEKKDFNDHVRACMNR